MTSTNRISGPLNFLVEDVQKLTKAIAGDPDVLRDLDDEMLLGLAAWTGNEDEVITAECRRRAEQGRKFSAYLKPELTHDELVVISDVLGRVKAAAESGDLELLKIALGFTAGITQDRFAAALEKIDDAKIVTRPSQS